MNYHIQVQTPATYTVWVRGMALEAGSDSVHLEAQTDVPAHTRPFEIHAVVANLTGFTADWAWSKLTMAETPAQVYLPSDAYTLTLSMREDGLRVDRILLITDTNYIPTGEGPSASPTGVITSTSGGETIFQVVTYGYDTLYRLEQAVYSGTLNATYDYAYDNVGNRTAYTQTVQNGETVTTTTTYQYNSANHLWQSTADGVTTTYSWDNAGRLITTTVDGQPTRLYSYSQDGEMEAAVVNGLLTTFLYNGKGQRLALATGGITTTYMLDYGSRINRVLYESNPNETKHYLYGGDLCLAELVTDEVEEETEWRYYLYDGNGYVRQTVDENAIPTYAWTFSPEGAVLLGEQGPVTHLSCNGDAVYDWSTGLIYKNGRYFDPNTGIWVTIGVVVASGNHKRRKGRGKRKGKEPTTYLWLALLLLLLFLLAGCGGPTPTPIGNYACPTPTATELPLPTVTPTLPSPIVIVPPTQQPEQPAPETPTTEPTVTPTNTQEPPTVTPINPLSTPFQDELRNPISASEVVSYEDHPTDIDQNLGKGIDIVPSSHRQGGNHAAGVKIIALRDGHLIHNQAGLGPNMIVIKDYNTPSAYQIVYSHVTPLSSVEDMEGKIVDFRNTLGVYKIKAGTVIAVVQDVSNLSVEERRLFRSDPPDAHLHFGYYEPAGGSNTNPTSLITYWGPPGFDRP